MKEMLAKLYDYDCWANALVFDHAAQLSNRSGAPPSALRQPAPCLGAPRRRRRDVAYAYTIWQALTRRPPRSRRSPPSPRCESPGAGRRGALRPRLLQRLSEADIAGTVELTDPR